MSLPESEVNVPSDTGSPTFTFGNFIVRKAAFEEVARAPIDVGEQRPAIIQAPIEFQVWLQLQQESFMAMVTVETKATPDPKWQPYNIQVTVSGIFEAHNVTREQFEEFCRLAAPTILLPYIRQIIHNLTADAEHGEVRINPLNMQEILKGQWAKVEASSVTAPSEPQPPSSQ